MTDIGFVVAAYGAVGVGIGLYLVTLWRRLRHAREASLRIRREAAGAAGRDATG